MKKYDFSNESTNPYTVEMRHNVMPRCIQCQEDTEIILDGNTWYQVFVTGNVDLQNSGLPREAREMFITGVHPECWDKMFS